MQENCLCVARKALAQVQCLVWTASHFMYLVIYLQWSSICLWLNLIHFHARGGPHSWEGWTLGSTGVAFDPGHKTAKCGGYSEGALAKIWKKLFYQVKGAHCCMTCLIISANWRTETNWFYIINQEIQMGLIYLKEICLFYQMNISGNDDLMMETI